MDSQHNDPVDKPNDTKATDEVAALRDVIEQRRLDLGIKPGEKPTQITARMPAREMSPGEAAARDEAAKRMALAEQKARRQGMFAVLCDKVGERYAKCTFGNFKVENDRQKSVVSTCREYAMTLPDRLVDRTNLVLYGPVGTGKDHLAFAVCGIAIFSHGKHVGWVNGQEWFGQIRDGMDDDRITEQQLVQRLVAPDVLVISDPLPPVGSLTQHQCTMLYRLVDKRYAANKVTVITVNVQRSEEADARMGVPTWDRLRDDSWEVFCNWASHRKPARIVNGK
jgi:DNA replication protein DnaC